MEVSTEVLRKQVMVSQFVNAVGCSPEEATQILTSVRWQFEVALSVFFQGHSVAPPTSSVPGPHHHNQSSCASSSSSSSNINPGSSAGSSLGSRMSCQACVVPTNTPATPPQFPDTLAAFAQLQTSSPAETTTALLQEPIIVHCQTQASKS